MFTNVKFCIYPWVWNACRVFARISCDIMIVLKLTWISRFFPQVLPSSASWYFINSWIWGKYHQATEAIARSPCGIWMLATSTSRASTSTYATSGKDWPNVPRPADWAVVVVGVADTAAAAAAAVLEGVVGLGPLAATDRKSGLSLRLTFGRLSRSSNALKLCNVLLLILVQLK